MRKIILQEFVTVDGFAADPDGKLDFMMKYASTNDVSYQDDALRFLNSVDTMMLGANTYEMFAGYWPGSTAEGSFAEKLNALHKVVVSSTLKDAPWGNWEAAEITARPAEKIAAIKRQPGKDIVIWGSLTLAQSLIKDDLVDEIQFRICPSVLGEGKRLLTEQLDLKLLEVKEYDKGMVLLRYGRA